MADPRELVYGIALTTLISQILAALKHTSQDITVFSIYDKIIDDRPELAPIVSASKAEKEKFYRRIRHCLNSLCDTGMIDRHERETKTKAIYYIYIVKF